MKYKYFVEMTGNRITIISNGVNIVNNKQKEAGEHALREPLQPLL